MDWREAFPEGWHHLGGDRLFHGRADDSTEAPRRRGDESESINQAGTAGAAVTWSTLSCRGVRAGKGRKKMRIRTTPRKKT